MSEQAVPTTRIEQDRGIKSWLLAVVTAIAIGISTCMTVAWFGMRGVMSLGGFIASGGPYVIAHEAPSWIWLLPVSLVGLIGLMFVSYEVASSFDTPSLMLVAWSGLFLSMGWNFLEFGLRPPGGGVAVGWLVSAAAFVLTGLGGLYVLVQTIRAGRRYDREKAEAANRPVDPVASAYLIGEAVGLAAGIPLGVLAFQTFAG